MDLQSFSSIFEIFATFTLAYIIIDELTENPFISIISEKILRKYRVIDEIYAEIRANIGGRKTSLYNIAQQNIDHKDIKEGYDPISRVLTSTEERTEQSFSEIKGIIRGNYSTKVFVYLNCFLFLYCLTLLFYGGVYSDGPSAATQAAEFRCRVDNSLFWFNIFSIIFVSLGWIFDKKRKHDPDNPDNPDDPHSSSFFESVYKGKFFNGYIFSFVVYIVAAVLAIMCFFFDWTIIHFELINVPLHNILVVVSILLPVSNFLIYILKASKRANKCLPHVNSLARAFRTDYLNELKKIDNFISMCDHVTSNTISVVPTTQP